MKQIKKINIKSQLSMKAKLTMAFSGILAVILIAICVATSFTGKLFIGNEVSQNLETRAKYLAESVDKMLRANATLLKILSRTEAMSNPNTSIEEK